MDGPSLFPALTAPRPGRYRLRQDHPGNAMHLFFIFNAIP
jgi:hypothetical protein